MIKIHEIDINAANAAIEAARARRTEARERGPITGDTASRLDDLNAAARYAAWSGDDYRLRAAQRMCERAAEARRQGILVD